MPDDWAIVTADSGLTVAGEGRDCSAALGVSGLTAGKAWVRWGVAFYMDSEQGTTAPGAADVTLSVVTVACGSMVGSWRGSLVSSVTADAVVPVTSWVPSVWAQKVMAAFIVASASGNFRCRLVYRVAETSTDAPGSWQDTTDTNVAGNSERNTGNLTLTLGSNLMVQFGVAYSSSSGTSVGEVAVSVGVRRT